MNFINWVKRKIRLLKFYLKKIIDFITMRREKDKKQYNVDEFNDENIWEVVVGQSSKSRSQKYDEKMFIEEYHRREKKDFIQEIIGTKIIIKCCEERDQIADIKTTYIEENPSVVYVTKDRTIAAISKFEYKSYKLRVTCAHVLQMLPFEQQIKYKHINPLIVVHINAMNKFQEYKWLVKAGDSVDWWTRDTTNGKHVYILTKVVKTIFGRVPFKGRLQPSAIAIIVSIIPESNYVYSGTLMSVNNKPFIVTYVNRQQNRIRNITAVAFIQHKYTIEMG